MAKRILFVHLIRDLNFCCEWAFFKVYRRTGAIAERLGVDPRTVRYHKMAFKQGDCACEKRENCLRGKLI